MSRQPVEHPYVRISDPTQRKGGGLERQTTNDLEAFGKLFSVRTGRKVRQSIPDLTPGVVAAYGN